MTQRTYVAVAEFDLELGVHWISFPDVPDCVALAYSAMHIVRDAQRALSRYSQKRGSLPEPRIYTSSHDTPYFTNHLVPLEDRC